MRALLLLLVSAFFISGAQAQEMGELETFGAEGKLYSTSGDEYYLLSRQLYRTEDSSGYMGEIRIKKIYPGGGYEFLSREYTARCFAPFDNMVYIVVLEAGKEETDDSGTVYIKSPERFPGMAKKDAYNLYWAACHNRFQKFK